MPNDGTGAPAPDKTIVIDTPNPTLDRLSGKSTEDPKDDVKTDEPIDKGTDGGNDGADGNDDGQKSAIRSIPDDDPDDKGASDGDDTKKDDNPTDDNPTDPEPKDEPEVDLSELAIEVDGQERSVAELLDERDQLAKRVAEEDSDPFLKGLIDHYKATGNIDAYYEAKGVDWDKKDDIEVLRISFDKEYSDLDAKTREKLWKRELASKYKIKDDLSEEELESDDYQIAQGLLKRDANKVRGAFKENQQKYQAPEKEEPKPVQKFDAEAYKKRVLGDKNVQTFMKNKLLPIGVKDGTGKTLGFEPQNPDQIIEMMVDDRKFWSVFVDPKTGQVDRTKVAKVYAYAQDPDFHEQSLVNLGKNLQLEQRLKEDKGIDDRLNRKTGAAPPKESFAKGFLTQALKQKK